MKTVKTLIIFSALLIMVAVIADMYFLAEVTKPNKNTGAYIGVGAMAVLLVALVFISFVERKMRKTQLKIEEKDQEIGRLQKELEKSNEVLSIVPPKGEDVEM